jgi:HPt (histidine-containing phosphotransfer) domain-containing protein
MIDWSRVAELVSEIGEDGFAEVVELFLDEVESVVIRLRDQPDLSCLEEDMHFLKGGAWNLGFADFGDLCQDGEKLAASGNASQVDLDMVVRCYFASKDSFLADLPQHVGCGASSAA